MTSSKHLPSDSVLPVRNWLGVVVASIAFLSGALALTTGAKAADAEPLPTTEIAQGVFVYQAPYELLAPSNAGAIANVAFVVGSEAVAVIDTGNSLQAGQRLLAAIRQKTKLPIRYVINTHMHPDHVLGDAVFRNEGAKFVAHANFRAALEARAQSYLDAGKRQMGDAFSETPDDIVLPDTAVAVGQNQTLDIGDRKLTLEAEPKAHTDNDLTAFDEKTGTWFLGDLLFVGHVPAIDGSLEGWLKVMAKTKERKVARVVPGHGPVSQPWPDALAPQQRYFDVLRTDVKKMLDGGADIRDASEKAGLSERDAWALFDEFNARNAISAYNELEWE